MTENKLRDFLATHVPGFSIIVYAFAALEFAILIVCILLSSNQDMIRIYSPDNRVVYENTYNMSHINEFKKIYGIENFKTEGYTLTRIEKEKHFPVRAWIALSVCIPLAITLFLVFIVRVYQDIFHAKEDTETKETEKQPSSGFEETRFEKLFSTLGRLNIYSLGSTVIIIGFLYWMVPDLLIYIGKISYQTLAELKWVILCIVLVAGIYMMFKMFLSYKTRKEIIKHQAQIQENRDRLMIQSQGGTPLLDEKRSGEETKPPGQ